jgi:hypothetical protein
MFSIVAVLVYLLALLLPALLLYRYGSSPWYWHVLIVAAAIGVGLIPMRPEWNRPEIDLALGFAVVFMLVWGIGGLVVFRPHQPHHAKHA